MNEYKKLTQEIKTSSKKEQAEQCQRFFKTGKGEYGEGDTFIGIKVPILRSLSRKYKKLPLVDTVRFIQSPIHEYRMVGLFILIFLYKAGDESIRRRIFDLYLKNTKHINNWDLVDLSAPNIVGDYLLDKPRNVLYKLARSKSLWEKRISVLATFAFIRNNDFKDTIKLSELLLNDKHDLIHKAVGWMLREVGKRDQAVEEVFLGKYYRTMPRTMLRYSIEKFTKNKRMFYLGLI